MLTVTRSQWPVGQGCFSTGHIERDGSPPLDYVYDCGARNRQAINNSVAQYADTTSRVHGLFISHLDADHVDGLDSLFARVSVDTVYLPYMDVAERVMALVHAEHHDRLTASLAEAYLRPGSWFRSRGANRVVLVRNQLGSTDMLPPEQVEIRSDEPGDMMFVEQRQVSATSEDGVYELKAATPILVRNGATFADWMLLPHVPASDAMALLLFRNGLRKLLGLKERHPIDPLHLISLLKSRKGRLDLRGCYEPIVKRSDGSGHNLVSMSLYSGPVEPGVNRWTTEKRQGSFPVAGPRKSPPGWIGCGDAKLRASNIKQQWMDAYASVCKQVGTLLLPHHGSKHNFSPDLLDPLPLSACIAAADDLDMGYRHPSRSVIEAIVGRGIPLLHVTKSGASAVWERARLLTRPPRLP